MNYELESVFYSVYISQHDSTIEFGDTLIID